jgi:hypothetical protein
MAQQEQDRFVKELQQTASAKSIPIERLSCRDLPDKDGFEMTIASGGKERVFTISDSQARNDPDAEIELIINQLIDNV